MTPERRPDAGRRLKRDLIEAAVRDNRNLLAEAPSSRERRRGAAASRLPPRFSPRILLLLAPFVGAAVFGYLELRGATLRSTPVKEVEPRTETPELRFVGPPAAIDPKVFPLPVRRIVLDPGHGGSASGSAADGLAEKDLTLDIARRLRTLLANRYQVALTRDADIDVKLDERPRLANRAGADLFVSVHVNWLREDRPCGVETFHLGATDDPALTELAKRENAETHGYTLSDMRQLLDGLYTRTIASQSRALAESVQTALYAELRTRNPSLRDRGTKTAPFFVLVAAEMPAILAEVSCLSDPEEVERLQDASHLQTIARALDLGIRRYADSLLPTRRLALDAEAAETALRSPVGSVGR